MYIISPACWALAIRIYIGGSSSSVSYCRVWSPLNNWSKCLQRYKCNMRVLTSRKVRKRGYLIEKNKKREILMIKCRGMYLLSFYLYIVKLPGFFCYGTTYSLVLKNQVSKVNHNRNITQTRRFIINNTQRMANWTYLNVVIKT